MLKAQIIGYIGQDAFVSATEAGSSAHFQVAHTEKRKANGVQKERTTWVSCSIWDKENVYPYLKKGQLVVVEGVPGVKQYKNKQDELIPQLTIRVLAVQLLGGRRDDADGTVDNNTSATGDADDLPF